MKYGIKIWCYIDPDSEEEYWTWAKGIDGRTLSYDTKEAAQMIIDNWNHVKEMGKLIGGIIGAYFSNQTVEYVAEAMGEYVAEAMG